MAADDHKLLCGSALEPQNYATLMGEERAVLMLTDPPYNERIQGHVSGLGAARHGEFGMASGEMSRSEFTSFLTSFMRQVRPLSRDGALIMCFMD